ncbi:hypothetical protein ACIBG8_46735 [Nonomuraea sp. NPDC050556]|uniref:hypothetical protein n=1 Tax=Nonomuraea sp. NPDC050556 TaxID=3364369 RepID=UPI0037BD67E5
MDTKRLRDAAEELAAVVVRHANALSEPLNPPEIFALNDALAEAAGRFADAQFDLTGTFPQFTCEEEPAAPAEPTEGLAVLRRHDFVITDREALMAAGRAAYLRVWPDDTEKDAASDVHDVNRAIYQLLHAAPDPLDNIPGLRPGAWVQLTLAATEPLNLDDPFEIYYD